MKKKFILIPFLGAFLYVLLSSYSEGPAITAGIEGTGATGSAGCSCHNASSSSSTSVSIQLLSGSTPVTTYVPGNTYTIQITGTQTSSSLTLPRFGFQLMVVKSSGAGSSSAVSTGTFGSAPSGTHTYSIGGRSIFEQYNGGAGAAITATTGSGGSGTTYVESISWTAPSAGTGSVVIYGVVNAVNYNGTDDAGDKWNNTSATICESVGSVTGTPTVCAGATTTLNCTPSGGTWSSGTTGTATVTSGGVVSGVTGAGGTSVISYNAGCSGTATATVTVNAIPAAIGGALGVCSGAASLLTDASTPGTWTSVSTSIATITSGGNVTGVSTTGGTSLIRFTQTSAGCSNTAVVTVNPMPTAISGVASLCQGGTLSLGETLTGGTWSSGSTGIATVSSSGLVSGVSTGSSTPATAVITYTSSAGCSVFATVTVNPLPAAITGTAAICPGGTTTLSDPTGTGTWTSGSTGIATVVSGTGFVTAGSTGGTSIITFTFPATGCSATKILTVNPSPSAISGSLTVCPGGTSGLTDGGGGTWLSGSTTVATIGSASGSVTGVSSTGGTSVITYTLPLTGCTTTAIVTVTATPAPITGALAVCQGTSGTLIESTGVWTSSNIAVATIGSSTGVVSGVVTGSTSPATALITFVSSGGCSVTANVTVNPAPDVISGVAQVCSGSSISLSDATSGGTWSSADNSIATVSSTGTVNGLVAAPVNISYTLPGTGCYSILPVTVNPLPGIIGGATQVCSGSSATLTDAGGGTWASSDGSIATVGATSGTVNGISTVGGNVLITYSLPVTGCSKTTSFTVNPLPSAISGPTALCAGGVSYTLTDVGGGTWASSNSTVAPIGASSGIITTGTTGTPAPSMITYTLLTGCSKTTIVTVNPLPSPISGASHVCLGSAAALIDGGGGTWASSDGTTATIGSVSGIINGLAIGTVAITYTLNTGCSRITTETVNPAATAISGTFSVCRGATTTLTDGGGGTWASSNASIAPIGSASGTVTGGIVTTPATATITYSLPTGCTANAIIPVNPISAITGVTSICAGLTATLSDLTTGGNWTSSNTGIATIGSSSGLVNSSSPGTTVITYTTAAGCMNTTTLSVISSTSAISGPNQFCLGSTGALTDVGGGVWSSSVPGTAAVGSSSGIVTPAALGTAVITYSLGTGCTVTLPVTVNAAVAAISGTDHVCAASSITLTDGGGGAWTSGDIGIATVGASTGSVTGVAGGTVAITYALASGCSTTKSITVNALPAAIFGQLNICVGTTTTLTDASGAGSWNSSATGIASISSTSGIMNGIAPGSTNITFTQTLTGCAITTLVSVNTAPPAITGPASVCEGAGITELNSTTGGSWSISNTNATIGSVSGDVTGVTAGTSVVTYTTPIGCTVLRPVTVNTLPSAISSTTSLVCVHAATSFTDASAGGTWDIAPIGIATVTPTSGAVTGRLAGTALLTYTLAGCSTTTIITVNPAPSAIGGTANVCVGLTSTLTDAGGGTWSSNPSTVATVGLTSGDVLGISGGSAIVTYTLPTGCQITKPFTVNTLPVAISGTGAVCIGFTTTLSDAGGGAWISSDAGEAAIGATSGIVTGISTGTPDITYTLPTGCMVTKTITVNALPALISGTSVFCAGDTATLSDASGSGVWSSSNPAANVGSASGFVTCVSAGTPVISYRLPSGCASTYTVTINALPSAIGGLLHLCAGTAGSLSDAGGGAWSSSSSATATIGSFSGSVSAISAGTSTITYTLPTGCMRTAVLTVNPLPVAGTIAGPSSVCVGATIPLTDTAPGGAWLSLHSGTATILLTTGVVSGVSAGVDTINYRVTNGCGSIAAVAVVTVNPLAVAGTISGPSLVCISSPATLAETVPGGIWSSSNTAVATVGATGIVSGVSAGVVSIFYSVTNDCNTAVAGFRDTVVTVPSAGTIVGSDSVCVSGTLTLTDVVTGGTWTTSNGNATVSPTGVVTGVTAGTDTVYYSIETICGPVAVKLIVHVKAVGTCNTGVSQVASAGEFNVYPNPSTGSFIIDIPETADGSVVTVCDVLGKVIERRVIGDHNPQKALFNLKNVAPGSYIIRVDAGDMVYRNKIVIW